MARLKKSFDSGVEKIRWIANILGERLKVETAVIRLLREAGDLEKRRDSLARDIGDRVFELRGRSELNLLGDSRIREKLTELEKLDAELEELRGRASEISKVEG